MIVPEVLWAGITYILYIPNQIILSNLSQIPIKYVVIFEISSILFLIFCIIFSVIGILIPDKYADVYSWLFFGCTLCGYIQYNFLNRKLAMLDGDKITYSQGVILGNYVFWIVGILVVCAVGALYKKKSCVWYKYISYLFSLTQLIAFVVALATTDYSVQHAEVLTNQYMNEFAKTNNIVVFVLDRYDEQYLERVLEEDPTFLEQVSDFTLYQNTISEYGHTYMVLPYILSGVEWQNKMPEEEYYKYANENAFFLERVRDLGYVSDVYSDSVFVQEKIGNNIRNWSAQLTMKQSFAAFVDLWNRISRYSILPYGMTEHFYYTIYDMEMVMRDSGKYVWGDDMFIYHLVADKGISVDANTDKLFKVIHTYGTHSPYKYSMDEQFEVFSDPHGTLIGEARASMGIVYKFIEKMKEKGIYDQATIIITADHGKSAMHEPEYIRETGFDYVSVPILLVKERGERHNELQRSKAPLTLHEMIPTLLRDMGDETYYEYGRCYDEIPEDEQRTRYFYWGSPPIPYMTFQIDGDALEERSWKIIESDLQE